uniref:BHLH domain-containing protein n=1 Tax=Caenorhabditis tropicalis TaxID=1561998 RepID=A0A1I7UB02_9PELO
MAEKAKIVVHRKVNQGFVLLQERVPKAAGSKTKLSKVETLREAARYIQELQKQLGMMPQGMAVDFPTPEQSPVYPKPYCNMMPQTPSPNYVSPYYPPPTQMMKHEMSGQYYSGQENSSSISSSSSDSNSGDIHSFYRDSY